MLQLFSETDVAMVYKVFWQEALFPIMQQRHRGHNTLAYSWRLIRAQVDQTVPPFLMKKKALHWDINIPPFIFLSACLHEGTDSHWGVEQYLSVRALAKVQSNILTCNILDTNHLEETSNYPNRWISTKKTKAGTDVLEVTGTLVIAVLIPNTSLHQLTILTHSWGFPLQMCTESFTAANEQMLLP